MRFPVLSHLIDSRLHPVPQNITFEFRKHGQHACESTAARGGEIERFAQRNEAHVERRQFLQRVNKVYERPLSELGKSLRSGDLSVTGSRRYRDCDRAF